jgi:hypothetical protein
MLEKSDENSYYIVSKGKMHGCELTACQEGRISIKPFSELNSRISLTYDRVFTCMSIS